MPWTPTTWTDGSGNPISAANLTNINTGISNAPYGPDASANFLPVWNGSAWVYQGVKNAQVDAAAAIAYSKLNLAGSIVNADIASGAAIVVTKLSPGSNGQFLTVTGGVATWGSAPASTTYRKSTSKTVSNTVTETDLLNGEITVAANAMGATGILRIKAWGDLINNVVNPGGPRLKLKLGATTLIDSGAPSAGADYQQQAARRDWFVEAIIANTATNAQTCQFFARLDLDGNAAQNDTITTGEGTYSNQGGGAAAAKAEISGYGTGAVDTTASQALVLSVINFSASVNVDMVLKGALVEVI